MVLDGPYVRAGNSRTENKVTILHWVENKAPRRIELYQSHHVNTVTSLTCLNEVKPNIHAKNNTAMQ